jgi:hypothetical protein
MPEPKGSDVRTLAVRVSPDFHALLTTVAGVDEMSLTDLMMKALENHVATRREAPDFKAKVQQAIEEAEAQVARTKATLLGTLPEAATGEASTDAPTTGRGRRKGEAPAKAGGFPAPRVEGGFRRLPLHSPTLPDWWRYWPANR